jgi:NADP-dependent 3-hydroxy acid dehydrogenase YdfG
MGKRKVWFITGAGRGMGVDFARAALADGHAVVATGRDTGRVSKALGQADDLLAVKLDITSHADAEAAVRTSQSPPRQVALRGLSTSLAFDEAGRASDVK